MTKISDERLAEIRRKVREEVMRSAAILRPEELALTVDDVLERALRAQGGVRLKPLEWSQGWGERRAATPFGNYRLSTNTTGHFDWHSPDGERHWASTEDAAKAAAQADYERRVLSTLEASPAPVSEHSAVTKARDIGRGLPAALAAKGGQ